MKNSTEVNNSIAAGEKLELATIANILEDAQKSLSDRRTPRDIGIDQSQTSITIKQAVTTVGVDGPKPDDKPEKDASDDAKKMLRNCAEITYPINRRLASIF